MQKKWDIKHPLNTKKPLSEEEIIQLLLQIRGFDTPQDQESFLYPKDPMELTPKDVGIDEKELERALVRIEKAIKDQESIVVYADYDADGVTAGAIMWETLYALGAKVMPYIPHRVDEGYGLSTIGIDAVIAAFTASLIITVDHGVTGREKVAYAKSKGVDVVVTDHHSRADSTNFAPMVHTTTLSGSGVSWFVAKTLLSRNEDKRVKDLDPYELVALATIGTIADLLPLTGPNRSLVHYGLDMFTQTARVGLLAMIASSGLTEKTITSFEVSHVLAPRINALGRIGHALDALRLLCTTSEPRAAELAQKLETINKERQNLTIESSLHAKDLVRSIKEAQKKHIIIIADESYNQGIIGLIAGKLVEEYFLPAIVLSKGELVSKASARSIPGFNIVEAIRHHSELLVDVGGHPMAAGFTIETSLLPKFISAMEEYAEKNITPEMRVRKLPIDLEIPLSQVSNDLYQSIKSLAPFGMGNPEPVFVSREVKASQVKKIGKEGKHLKFKVGGSSSQSSPLDVVGFGMGSRAQELETQSSIDIVYTIDLNVWNGKSALQLKVKDFLVH